MHKTTKDLLLLALMVIIVTFAIWLPHLLALPNFWGLNFSQGFATIYRNFDGLEYVIIAKTFYNPATFASIPQSLPANYFASHFPGYSILIALFALFLGYLKSMLLVSVGSTILATWAFYFLVRDFRLSSQPLLLATLFLLLPARWLIVHSVGASEPTFILFIILAIYLFMKFEESKQYPYLIYFGIAGLLAQITRPPGILLFVALAIYFHWKLFMRRRVISVKDALLTHLKYIPILLIPLGMLLVFYLFSVNYGDFWAYFKSGDNIHLTFPPFQVFNKSQFWVGDIWLEDIVYIFILGFLGGVTLWKKKLYPIAFFVLTYLTAATFIAHRDISRYVLPVTPFILIAFEKVLVSRKIKIILPIVLLVIYLYAQNFILSNTAPIPNLEIFN